MLESIRINSRKKLNRITGILKSEKRGTCFDEMWDLNGRFYILHYYPRRCGQDAQIGCTINPKGVIG